MKGKSHKIGKKQSRKMKGALCNSNTRQLQLQLGQVSLIPLNQPSSTTSSSVSCFQNPLDSEPPNASSSCVVLTADAVADDRDGILSQDFFCTPDYITPDNQNIFNGFDCDTDDTPCPKSPEKITTTKSKRCRLDAMSVQPLSPTFSSDHQPAVELGKDSVAEEFALENTIAAPRPKGHNYVSQSAVALRCRVMPPPCFRNPYLKDVSEKERDPFGNQRLKCAGLFPANSGDGLSRYRADFHEIEQIGRGNFSNVFKVLKRIDGCLYAVKQSIRPLLLETERTKALMEVQALASLGLHKNIVGYYSSWFENEHLYIQMELCDHSLSIRKFSAAFSEAQVLDALFQVANALRFIHAKGMAHLDVKPDNIYVKNGVYKLGDFGCATLLDSSLPIEEGDARYMPQEILNENYDNLDKVDIFSLGASIYELIRRLPLPESGCQFFNLKEGKFPLLPGHSLHLQNLLKVMMDPDPVKRPSAKELVENPIFCKKIQTTTACS
ncbi:hypothetical protein PHAVU_001G204900 [Phaseolus vulgaris]|uniref:Wee1-like protein kinase n=1 Tax=Phaseolus vulgaris TaxID=3885 RepID=V7D0N8_PHAVU|nr:hypothetical protein PHAVU_001G204900g [Phaseolus vulgaris]ESW35080.1 hypothetical protein PHAVU_001G204900g [Phaseolus vulgaris]